DQSPPTSCKQLSAADCPPGFPGCESYDDEAWAQETEEATDAPSIWLTLGGQLDFLLLPSSAAACFEGSEYGCYYGGGAYRDPSEPFIDRNGQMVVDPSTGQAM